MSFASALIGEMYRQYTLSSSVPASACLTNSSIIDKNAVSVLPDPVGEQSNRWSLSMIEGMANFCGFVKSGNLSLNQFLTG